MLGKMKWVIGPIMLIGTSFLSSAVNLMGLSLAAATFVSQALLNSPSVRKALGIPLNPEPKAPAVAPGLSYEAPRQPQSMREKLEENLGEMKKGFNDSISKVTGQVSGSAEDQAAKKRKDLIKKLEEKRQQQEKDHFEQKYKGKK